VSGRRRPDRRPQPAARGELSARQVALRCLVRIERDGAYANIVTPAELTRSGLSERDRGFVTELVYGATRMRRACDALVDRFIVKEPDAVVRTILRLGAYQLAFANVAAHAAVGETVELAPKQARGFVNAVLRNVTRTEHTFPSKAAELSYPDWIAERLRGDLGDDDAWAAMAAMNEAAEVTERDDGYIQDRGSQWVAAAVESTAGETVLDVCAAPGGKATAIAASGALVVAADLQPQRLALINGNTRRLGLETVRAVCADGAAPPFRPSSFHHVLIDAPCSGLGALRRRPDARWRITAADVTHLAALQQRMIDACAPLVRPGGTLTYSVCTVLAEESTDHTVPPSFTPIIDQPAGRWRPFGAGWRVLPHDAGTDGMVLLRYRRQP
jgi:16S rRNA (cytosine967-C5)-methyltransferase